MKFKERYSEMLGQYVLNRLDSPVPKWLRKYIHTEEGKRNFNIWRIKNELPVVSSICIFKSLCKEEGKA